MRKEPIIGVLVLALLVVGIMYLGRGDEIEQLRGELKDARDDIRLMHTDAFDQHQRLDACGQVLRRARELVEAQAQRIYRIYDDEMPELARQAFDLGVRGDEDELFFGTVRLLDEQRKLQLVIAQDIRDYGWAPSSSLEEGDTNLAGVCLGVDEESLHS